MPVIRLTARRAVLLTALLLVSLGLTLLPSVDEYSFIFDYGGMPTKRQPDYSDLLMNYPLQDTSKTFEQPVGSGHDETPPLLSIKDATDFCDQIKLKPFPRRDRRRKVYDLFIIGTELDWAEIRLETLASEVDYFVILEATRTFTNAPKPLHFKKNWDRFAKFKSKILYHVLTDDAALDYFVWDREHYQRDALLTQVFPSLLGNQAPNDGDVLIVSDVDEIPRPETIVRLRNCDFPERTGLMSRFFLYSFQWRRADMDWYHPQATFWQGNKTLLPESVRMGQMLHTIHNASWHCTSCFQTIAQMVNKITSFSHIEFDKPEFKDPDAIVQRVRNGSDLFDRNFKYIKVAHNQLDVPDFLGHNKDRYRYLVDRDGPNASFEDYAPPRT